MWLIILTNIVPTVFLCMDMLMSKIRYPPRLVILGYVHICVWLVLTYIMQITSWPEDDEYKPIYYENLNWACEVNFSYTFKENEATKTVNQTSTAPKTCHEINPNFTTDDCHNLFRTYFCDLQPLLLENE